jgi:hypothetical protein
MRWKLVHVPQMPVTSEALTSLHNLIKQDAHALDESSKQRLQRHLQKFANAAQISFAERALLWDQIRFLSRMNNEAKVCRSTKSVVLKVMSYEDIEEARAERGSHRGQGKTWSEAQESCARGRCARAEGQSGADEMRLPHEEWRIIARFFSSDRFLEAGSRGLRDLLLYSRELAFVAPLAQWNRNCNDLLVVIRLVDTCS